MFIQFHDFRLLVCQRSVVCGNKIFGLSVEEINPSVCSQIFYIFISKYRTAACRDNAVSIAAEADTAAAGSDKAPSPKSALTAASSTKDRKAVPASPPCRRLPSGPAYAEPGKNRPQKTAPPYRAGRHGGAVV